MLRARRAVVRDAGGGTELTLGSALHVDEFLTFEQGATLGTDGSWQLLFGLSDAFGGD